MITICFDKHAMCKLKLGTVCARLLDEAIHTRLLGACLTSLSDQAIATKNWDIGWALEAFVSPWFQKPNLDVQFMMQRLFQPRFITRNNQCVCQISLTNIKSIFLRVLILFWSSHIACEGNYNKRNSGRWYWFYIWFTVSNSMDDPCMVTANQYTCAFKRSN